MEERQVYSNRISCLILCKAKLVTSASLFLFHEGLYFIMTVPYTTITWFKYKRTQGFLRVLRLIFTPKFAMEVISYEFKSNLCAQSSGDEWGY